MFANDSDTAWSTLPVSGGPGASSFLDLSDAPVSYAAQALKAVRVNAAENALEFFTITAYTDEEARDAIAAFVQNGTGISWSHDDVGNTLTPTVSLAAFSTSNLSEGSNLYWTQARFNTAFSAKTTSDLGEGSNLYYTDVRADARISAQKGAANGLATLGADSKIPTSQLPAIALTDVFVVASEAAQLALTVEEGDVVIRTDLNKSFIHNGGISGTMDDWSELLSPIDSVLSVNGLTGAVTLTTSNISENTNLYFTTTRAVDAIKADADWNATDWDTAFGWGNHASAGYALLAGRSGGQTLIGGTGASEALTLQSTAHATKGKLLFGTSAYDEVNNRLGIGTASPATKLEIVLSSEDGIDVSGTSVSPWNFDPMFSVSAPSGQAVRMVPQANLTENVSNVFNFNTNLWWGGSGSFTATNATGFFGRLSFQETTSDTITNAYGLRWDGILNQGSGSPSVGTQYGVHVDTRDFAATNWGLYVANRTNTNNYLGIGNTAIGGTTFGASAKAALHIFNGTAPTGSVSDGAILYSADISGTAGNAGFIMRTESGNLHSFGSNVGIGTTSPTEMLDVAGPVTFVDYIQMTNATLPNGQTYIAGVDNGSFRIGGASTFKPQFLIIGDAWDVDTTRQGEMTFRYGPNGQALWQHTPGGSGPNVTNMRLDANGNIGLGQSMSSSFAGASAESALHLFNNVAPSAGVADGVILYSQDLSAGNATLGLRTETAVVTEAVTSDRTLTIKINGTNYKILLKS